MKKILKKIWRAYMNGIYEMYGEAWRHGVNPFI